MKLGRFRELGERIQPPVCVTGKEKVQQMKAIKSLVAIACALAFMASVTIARAFFHLVGRKQM